MLVTLAAHGHDMKEMGWIENGHLRCLLFLHGVAHGGAVAIEVLLLGKHGVVNELADGLVTLLLIAKLVQ